MSYNVDLQSNNEELQDILKSVSELPDAVTDAVRYSEQSLDAEQQEQARQNIGALGESHIPGIVKQSKDAVLREIIIPVSVIHIKEKYGIDDTGNADCSALINQAIVEAKDRDTLYLPNGTYKLDSTVTVNKSVNLKFEGTMKYSGTDFAFLFKNFNYSKAEFNRVQSPNGSCIKLFSDWSTEKNFIQYSQFSFFSLTAKKKTDTDPGGYCIFAEMQNSGWINENRFTGGQFTGEYGVYADCKGRNGFNGNLFDSCGVENVGIGFYLANNCRNNLIFRCRHSENFTKFIQTVGVCSGLKIISNSPFKISENDISTETTGTVIASLTNESGTFYGTNGTFVRGTVVCDNQDRTKNLYSEPSGVFDLTNSLDYDTEYKNFIVDGPCSGIKLNKKYGAVGGINEFYLKFANANTKTFPITDYAGNVLSYTIPQVANSAVRFYWVAETGWQFDYVFSDAEQVKNLIQLSDYVRSAEAVKTVNDISPDENGNIEIVVVQEDPIVVGSIEECVDTTKKYVLPDGYIYAYRKRFYPGGTYPNFINQLPIALAYDSDGIYNGVGYKYDTSMSNSGVVLDSNTAGSDFLTGRIPVKLGDTVRINQISAHKGLRFAHFLSSTQKYLTGYQIEPLKTKIDNTGGSCTIGAEDVNQYVIVSDVEFTLSEAFDWWFTQDLAYMAFHCMGRVKPQDIIITVNEEITYTVTEDRYEWSWENTGELYVKPDYLGMIKALEERVAALEKG